MGYGRGRGFNFREWLSSLRRELGITVPAPSATLTGGGGVLSSTTTTVPAPSAVLAAGSL